MAGMRYAEIYILSKVSRYFTHQDFTTKGQKSRVNLKANWKVFYDDVFGDRQNQTRLIICFLTVVVFYFFSRLPFFLYYPLPIVLPDTSTYLWQLEKIDNGILPTFELRTPGYPLFWWLCRIINHNILFVIYAQNAITLFSTILILLLLARYSPQFLVPVTFALSVFISSPQYLAADMFLLTESIFVNSMMLFSVLLYVALRTHKIIFGLMTSLSAAAAIYIRPNAVFLIPILAIATLFLCNRCGRRFILSLLAPAAVVLGILLLYNALTIKLFNLTGGGDYAMLWSTSIYIEPDPSLPDDINKAILSNASKISNSDKNVIYNSWDLLAFQQTIEKNILYPIKSIVRITGGPGPDPYPYLKQRELYRQLYRTAIRQHPEVYFKNLLGAFILYFMKIGTPDWGDFYSIFPFKQYWETFVKQSSDVKNLKHYYNAKPPSGFSIVVFNGRKTLVGKLHTLTKLYMLYARIRGLLFANMLWIIPLGMGLMLSVLRLIGNRGQSTGSLFIFLMILCLLGHAVVCAATGHIEARYSYPLEFMNYLLFALAPYAFRLKNPNYI